MTETTVGARAVMRWLYGCALRHRRHSASRRARCVSSDRTGWMPMPCGVILLTGLCELATAAPLLTERWRRFAGIMLGLYALCVWPASIKHAVEHISRPHVPDSWWYHGPRLALQPVPIWWALFCAGAIDWPWRSSRDG